MTTRIPVPGARPYDVVVGHGVTGEVVAELPQAAAKVAVFHAAVFTHQARELAEQIRASGREPYVAELPDAEAAKTSATAHQCWELLGDAGFTRTDAIVSFGGGATTDVAGFVAATWLRGIAVLHVPTTLLAMVDAAVGGKTGINTSAGKNLVGSIHPPRAVVCDLDRLATLPRADLAAGLAEVIKAGFIEDQAILGLVEADPGAALDPASAVFAELVERAVRVKADVVGADLTESLDLELGRQVLNYGHTLGHAIEKVEHYTWRHGDAVAVGMCFAAALAKHDGLLTQHDLDRHRQILTSVGLPTRYTGGRHAELLAAMRVDKKARGATMRFVVLDGIGRPAVLVAPDEELLTAAFEEVS